MTDYTRFDHPDITSLLFYPRPESEPCLIDENCFELSIPVHPGVLIVGKIFIAGKQSPTILFFHGNGEIVSDYDDLGPLFVKSGINFMPVDYRGYGRSGGSPSVSSMMKDSLVIFEYARSWLNDNGHVGRFIVMGRSLGSASALEIASHHADRIDALIIDSGFAFALPLLRLIGVNIDSLGLREDEGFRNYEKIKKFTGPTLIIHAQRDQIIPLSDGQKLFESSHSREKEILIIPGADHNTIFMYGMREYLDAIRRLAGSIVS
ncbi:MAG: alpha/beta fold hydrolase [Spirochaetes bacterium]|nr:alpha/beta fold hydrolase [Spirochaetota bacterium]